MSSISVGSPLSDARRLLSRGSEEGTLDDNVEEGLWPDPGIAQNDDFDLSSDTDSFSDKAKVSGTKLNFNALSPVETENRTESTSTAGDEKGTLKPTHSNDLTETYESNPVGPSSSIFSHSFPSSLEKESSAQIVEIGTPSRLPTTSPHDRLNQSSLTRQAEFQYQLESTLCSPIHRSDGSCSPMLLEKESTTPTRWSNENCTLPSPIGPLHEKLSDDQENESNFLAVQKNNTSCLSTSSSKIRKLRPMPDESAFEGAGSARRRSSIGAKNKSILSSFSSSPLKFCPPTPVRTPAWAHNDGLTPAFGLQDSLTSSKVLAACPPELLDDFSSFEHSLGDDIIDVSSSVNQTPKNTSHLKQSIRFQHTEKSASKIFHETGSMPIKGHAGNISLLSSSTSGYSYPTSAVKKSHLSTSTSSRLDSSLNKSNGQVGSAISFEVDFDNLGQLGRGHFADVYKAQSKIDNFCYAIKRNRRQFRGKRDRDHALAEVRTMQRLQSGSKRLNDEKNKGFCPYLLLFIRAWQEDGYFYCQTELCCRDNCQNLIISVSSEWHIASKKYPSLRTNLPSSLQDGEEMNGRLLPESTIWKICHDIVSGLSHVHSRNMVHNDIKPSNIFFVAHSRLGCICKIGDFGLAGDIGSVEDGQEGDTKYMPQELLLSSVKQPSSDIFSMGLTVYELATDYSFDLPAEGPRWHAIRSGKNLEGIPKTRSSKLERLIQSMISPDPNKRPPAREILEGVHEVKDYGNLYEKFLADYVADVAEADLEREREFDAMQKEANLRRSTPTGSSILNVDRSWSVRTPTTDNFSSFLPVHTKK